MDKNVHHAFNKSVLEILKLYLSDYTKGLHVREIARLTNRNHRTIALSLKELEKTGVVKYVFVGKSKQYFLNLDNIITKEYIKGAESVRMINTMENHFIIKKLLTELSQKSLKNISIILFGSYAKGRETKESDIDILVISNDGQWLVKKIREFAERHNKNIQIHKSTVEQFELGLMEKDNLVVEIVKNHIVLNNIELFVDILWRHYHAK